MDLQHTPTSPEQIYKEVSTVVKKLWEDLKDTEMPGVKCEIKWKKQPYGAWCTITWFPRMYCHCSDSTCCQGKYPLKECTVIVKNDFGIEAFRHFIRSEWQWAMNFMKDNKETKWMDDNTMQNDFDSSEGDTPPAQ